MNSDQKFCLILFFCKLKYTLYTMMRRFIFFSQKYFSSKHNYVREIISEVLYKCMVMQPVPPVSV